MELHYIVGIMMIFVFIMGIIMTIYSYKIMDHVEMCIGADDAKHAARGLLTMSVGLIGISATYLFTYFAICKESTLYGISLSASILYKTILVAAVLTILIYSLIFSLKIQNSCTAAQNAGNTLQWISIGGLIICSMVFVGYMTFILGHKRAEKR